MWFIRHPPHLPPLRMMPRCYSACAFFRFRFPAVSLEYFRLLDVPSRLLSTQSRPVSPFRVIRLVPYGYPVMEVRSAFHSCNCRRYSLRLDGRMRIVAVLRALVGNGLTFRVIPRDYSPTITNVLRYP